MIILDADFNARNKRGQVVVQVPEEDLAKLKIGEKVYLYDPVDVLYSEALVASSGSKTGRVSFDVDWESFVDGVPPSAAPEEDISTADANLSSLAEIISIMSNSTGTDFVVLIQTGETKTRIAPLHTRRSAATFTGRRRRQLMDGLLKVRRRGHSSPMEFDERNASVMPDVGRYVKQAM